MRPDPLSHLRIARPSRDLGRAERFWVVGLGLEVLYRAGAEAEGDHALVMLGWSEAAWHLELVGDPGGETPPGPTDEDLLVLYVGDAIDDGAVARLVDAGGRQVPARNTYWDRWGVTIVDPDGYRRERTVPGDHRAGLPSGNRRSCGTSMIISPKLSRVRVGG